MGRLMQGGFVFPNPRLQPVFSSDVNVIMVGPCELSESHL